MLRRCAVVLFVVLGVASGCAGSGGDEQSSTESEYTRADLARFTSIPPVPSYWQWPPESETPPAPFTREALDAWEPEEPSQAELANVHRKVGFIESRTHNWIRSTTAATLKGSAFATLFSTPEGAADAMRASEDFAHRWFTEVEKAEVSDALVEGLGDDAWGVRGGKQNVGEFVEYGWRRGNVLLEVYVGCTPRCPSSAEDAAREWATAIDASA